MTLWRHKGDSGPGHKTAGELGHSQFGTPLKEILHAEPIPDPAKWIMVPVHWGGFSSGPDDWSAEMGQSRWEVWLELNPGSEDLGPEAHARTAAELKRYAERYGGPRPQDPYEIVTYVYLPDPHKSAILLHVCVDDRPGLTVEQATADSDAIQTPIADEFNTEALGTGRKVTYHGALDPQPGDLPGTRQMWVSVYYAFAIPDRQAVVTVRATGTDLGGMSAAADDLDTFVRTITLDFADGTPFTVGSGS